MSQRLLIENLIEQYDPNSHTASTLFTKNISSAFSPKIEEKKQVMTAIPFFQLLSALYYIRYTTKRNITQVLKLLSNFQSNPDIAHLNAFKRILRYLFGTKDLQLHYFYQSKQPIQIVGFADADYVRDIDTRKSTSGYTFHIFGFDKTIINNEIARVIDFEGSVGWKSKLQELVALSTTEIELIALINCAKQEL